MTWLAQWRCWMAHRAALYDFNTILWRGRCPCWFCSWVTNRKPETDRHVRYPDCSRLEQLRCTSRYFNRRSITRTNIVLRGPYKYNYHDTTNKQCLGRVFGVAVHTFTSDMMRREGYSCTTMLLGLTQAAATVNYLVATTHQHSFHLSVVEISDITLFHLCS